MSKTASSKNNQPPQKRLQLCRFRDYNQNYSYQLQPGVHSYNIPRADFVFFSELKIYLKAANELGEAISESIVLEPISAGELQSVQLQRISMLTSHPLRLLVVLLWDFF